MEQDHLRLEVRAAAATYTNLDELRPGESSEELDIVNLATGNGRGILVDRRLAHVAGFPHAVVHVQLTWEDFLVISVRSFEKDTSPGELDLSASGHMTAADPEPMAAAHKELEEEIGVLQGDLVGGLTYVGGYPIEEAPRGAFHNREYRHCFKGELGRPPCVNDFRDGEVDGLVLVPFKRARALLSDEVLPKASALRHSLPFIVESLRGP